MNIDSLYDAVFKSSFGLSMGSIWQHLSIELSSLELSNEEKPEIFFKILKRLITEGHIKLAAKGNFLMGDIEEQIDLIKLAWPVDPEEDDLDGFGFWFLTTPPAGIVWLTSDGQEVWA